MAHRADHRNILAGNFGDRYFGTELPSEDWDQREWDKENGYPSCG